MLKAALASLSKLNEWLEKVIYLLAIFIVANMVLALFLRRSSDMPPALAMIGSSNCHQPSLAGLSSHFWGRC